MLTINNILICVDQTEPDQEFLNYLSNFSPLFKGENYKLTYKVFLPDPDKIFETKVPLDIKYELDKIFFSSENSTSSISVEFDPPPMDLVLSTLKHLSQISADFLILRFSEKNREEAVKITRNSACSVLLMPPAFPAKLSKILVPIDFSEQSLYALKMALTFAEKINLDIIINHIYYVPEGYHSEGKSYDEMAGLVNKNAKMEYQKLNKDLNFSAFNVLPSFILDDDKDPTDKIYKEALDTEAELIIMTSKGKTASGFEIMGNTAKALLFLNESIPMLILKNKKENADIADYIWKTASIN
ncbi:hypothetical protein BH23BAC1_BH23BAC1_02180 [soil metagenome]